MYSSYRMKCVFIPWLLLLGVFNIITAQYAFPNWQNVALLKPCNMSSIYTGDITNNTCSTAINGFTSGTYQPGNCIYTDVGDLTPSWTVDLGNSYTVRGIRILARTDGFNNKRMGNVQVTVDNTNVYVFPADTLALQWQGSTDIQATTYGSSSLPKTGRYVKLWKNTANVGDTQILLNVCEVEVWACSPGYYGQNCTQCKPECKGIPTLHEGLPCDDIQYPNTCPDPCESNSCQHGGTCWRGALNKGNTYTCQCIGTGYQGPTCQQDISECAGTSNPCHNGGTCVNTLGTYTCTCTSGYTGTHCDTDIDECLSVTCEHGGTCMNTPGSYNCVCSMGYTGKNCKTVADRSSSEAVSAGLVAGLLVGGVVIGAAIFGIVGFFWLRRRSRGAQDSPTRRHRDGSKVTSAGNSRTSSTAAVGEDTGPRQQEEPAVEYYSSANPDQVHLSPTKGKNRVTEHASPAISATANSPYYNTALDGSDEGVPSQTAATSSSPSAAAAESNYEEFGARGIYDRPEMYENRMEHHVYTGLKKK